VEWQARLKAYADRFDQHLESRLPLVQGRAEPLVAAMRYSVLAPGKRLRPVLCMAGADAVGGDAEGVLDAACALELVHAFSLIHDDLPAIDNDELRRGRPTCHVQFGEATAILAGDALFALAFELVAGMQVPAERVVRAVQILARASGADGLVAGEIVDVLTEGKPYDAATLEYIHSRKTGALIAASCEMGALLGGGNPSQVEALEAYGRHLGLAFQIADDILNETGTSDELGKAAGSDRSRGKATYPHLHGLDGAREAAAAAAQRAIHALPESLNQREFLIGLAEFTVQRKT
jgi:geranylgeranyl diphosphate synthase type II